MNDKIGRFVKIYMKNSLMFYGAVQSWSKDDGVSIKSTNGEIVCIPFLSEVCAYVFIMKKDGTFLRENSKDDVEPTVERIPEETFVDRTKSLVELHKLKAASELELARTKLKNPICTTEAVEYNDGIQFLQSLKNDPRKQSRTSKRRNSK